MYHTYHYKKIGALLLACSLLCLPACKKKHKKNNAYSKQHAIAHNKVNFPLNYDSITREEELENLAGLFDNEMPTVSETTTKKELTRNTTSDMDFDWTDDYAQGEQSFKTIYFDFDKHTVRADQKEVVLYDARQLKELLAEARQEGKEPLITIEGHACHSAGHDEYNLVKSQNRANAVFNVFKELGVPTENIKVVGRGTGVPAVIDGKKVTGSRTEQWANRRVEVHIVTA
ncbi:MAG TPA: OmpA family protein [Patescibacteria group bacterium]|jgi:outer membrane protein OmpA-like peptidoglycan-associated protein|nr:OmpA family protein [Patescibacteria group bacterium]